MSKSAADVRSRRTILIVEDDEMLRIILRLEFKKSGFEVREAENGQVGLASVVEMHPDVIITDIEMPVMDGFSFIAAVRRIHGKPFVPIIAISAMKNDGIAKMAKAAGANQFCAKPLTPKILLAVINSHLPAALQPEN